MFKTSHPTSEFLPTIRAQTRTYIAHAKINLFLHVTNKLETGFHSLESMVGFCTYGDRIRLDPSDHFHLSYSGPFAENLYQQQGTNLVEKAAYAYAEHARCQPRIAIHLEKNVPIASGIGGGSADAAAVLKGVSHFWGDISQQALKTIALSLGADIPMCLSGKASVARGIGEDLIPIAALPKLDILLANPMIQISTPAIFKARNGDFTATLHPSKIPTSFNAVKDLVSFLSKTRNDLAAPAIQLAPEIHQVLSALADQDQCLFTRMSGSGATCFAFFPSRKACRQAEITLRHTYSKWWFQSSQLISMPHQPITGCV